MDVISVALLISVVCNLVQITFYIVKLYGDYKNHKQELEMEQRRRSYNDLNEQDGAIFF
jgi:hypothetical protein